MREIIFGGASSLDLFLARPNHGVDWLLWSDDLAEVMAGFWPRVDTVIMGRKTYEVAVAMGQGSGYPGVATYVFSRTWTSSPNPGVTLVRENGVEFVRQLKSQPGKDICVMGGGDFARSLFEADLIDEVGFNVHPVLLGDGIPAFHRMTRQIDLELKDCRQFKTGCVLLTYRVRHPVAG
jgi:dihydrofolate reductase